MNTPPSRAVTPQVPFTVLGGYLGAGKTTLLNRLLHDNKGRRIALLINDFGAINIDAQLIESRTDQQINLTNGCVCCGLSDGFDEAIAQLLTSPTPPEHIVVEASGVADVHSLAQYGNTPGLTLDAVVVVADALNIRQKATDKYVANTVKRQLAAADLLLLNKVDLVSTSQRSDLRQWLQTLCNGAPIIDTTFCALPEALLLGDGTRPNRSDSAKDAAHPQNHPLNHGEAYVTWHYQSSDRLTQLQIDQFLQDLPNTVLRGKGFFNTSKGLLEWHQVGKQQRLTPAEPRQELGTTLVAIGLKPQLNPVELDTLASQHL